MTKTTTYHVHLYREMRVTFSPVQARSPREAAEMVRRLPNDQAVSIDECDGEDLAALVDVAGDESFAQSQAIDFEGERARKSARDLLAALQAFVDADALAQECGRWKWEDLEPAFARAREVIAGVAL